MSGVGRATVFWFWETGQQMIDLANGRYKRKGLELRGVCTYVRSYILTSTLVQLACSGSGSGSVSSVSSVFCLG